MRHLVVVYSLYKTIFSSAYRGRIAVFAIRVLRDERICVVAEQRPDCSEEESFQWMSRVLQAVDSIHQVSRHLGTQGCKGCCNLCLKVQLHPSIFEEDLYCTDEF